jgi:hypothetical protein
VPGIPGLSFDQYPDHPLRGRLRQFGDVEDTGVRDRVAVPLITAKTPMMLVLASRRRSLMDGGSML